MGSPKAALEWHGSTLLRRTVGIVARAAEGPVVVVRAPGQPLPSLPDDVIVVEDPREGKGPVQGIAAGLAALEGIADLAFVSSTDMPFLHPAFVRRVLRALAAGTAPDAAHPDIAHPEAALPDVAPPDVAPPDVAPPDVALPVARGYKQPVAAGYRVALAGLAERLVKEDRLRPAFLFSECAVAQLDDAALLADPVLAALDPDLDSVLNVNTPDDYAAARARPAPEITVQLFGTVARSAAKAGGTSGPHVVRAATVQGAADAVGLTFDRHVTAALNGDQITRDPRLPLAAGDTLFFLSADAGG
jgi:molybdopterin-guanine dinucleotide biosynthesis protein A